MAWEWSHSPEAYQNVRDNLELLSKEILIECLAEFREKELGDADDDREDFGADYDNYVKELTEDKFHTAETLAGELWPKIEELRTCDNGGHDAHLCPYGCGGHKVSFSSQEELAAEEGADE